MNDLQLDDSIRRALELEVPADQLARLESAWRRQSAAASRRTRVRFAALAASVAAVAVGGWLASRSAMRSFDQAAREADAPPVQLSEERPSSPPRRNAPAPVLAHVTPALQAPSSEGRHPTDAEQLVFAMRTGRSTVAESAPSEAAVEEAVNDAERQDGFDGLTRLARASRDPQIRSAVYERLLAAGSEQSLRAYFSLVASEALGREALAAVDQGSQRPVDALMKFLGDGDRATRLAAAVVLGRMNGPIVTERLIAWVTGPDGAPSEAWVALLACRGESADRFLAAASQHPRLLGHVNNARLLWARLMP